MRILKNKRISIQWIALVILLLVMQSCKKEPAIEISPDYMGVWRHYSSSSSVKYLEINDDSRGHILYYENDEFKDDTQYRKWLIKKSHLYFGWIGWGEDNYTIDQAPTITSTEIILDHDTVKQGESYMILDGGYYINQK